MIYIKVLVALKVLKGLFDKAYRAWVDEPLNLRLLKHETFHNLVFRHHNLHPLFQPKQYLRLSKNTKLRQIMFTWLSGLISLCSQGNPYSSLEDDIDVAKFFCLVYFCVGLKLEQFRGHAQVDEQLGFHVNVFGEKGYSLKDLCYLHAFKGHSLILRLRCHPA